MKSLIVRVCVEPQVSADACFSFVSFPYRLFLLFCSSQSALFELCGNYGQFDEQWQILCSYLETFQAVPLYLLRTANRTVSPRCFQFGPASQGVRFRSMTWDSIFHTFFIVGPGDVMNKLNKINNKKLFSNSLYIYIYIIYNLRSSDHWFQQRIWQQRS